MYHIYQILVGSRVLALGRASGHKTYAQTLLNFDRKREPVLSMVMTMMITIVCNIHSIGFLMFIVLQI